MRSDDRLVISGDEEEGIAMAKQQLLVEMEER